MDLFLPLKPRVLILNAWVPNLVLASSRLLTICDAAWACDETHLMELAGRENKPDLILLDTSEGGCDGLTVCTALKSNLNTSNIPVIFFGGPGSDVEKIHAYEVGAIDYIQQPVNVDLFFAKLKVQLRHKSNTDFVEMINDQLEIVVARRTEEILAVQDATILAMTSLAQTRDSETGSHIRRTQHYVLALSGKLQRHPRFSGFLTEHNINLLFKSSPLHDIGKVGIPDRILLKPGRFDAAEMEIMKTHTTLGRDAIEQVENMMGCKLEFLTMAKEIAYCHQEKWDGSGYPQGLIGDAIPISARLMALADVYDAIISRRIYKEGMSHETAVDIILTGKGKHFDPDIVDAFVSIIDQFKDIAERFADSDTEMKKKVEYLELA